MAVLSFDQLITGLADTPLSLERHRGGVAPQRGINQAHDCLLVARDRNKATLDFHIGRGPVRPGQLKACLRGVLAPAVLLVSDGAPVYQRFASETGVSHRYVNLSAGSGLMAISISTT